MTSLTGAEAAVRMLQAYGVKHIFGLCGDTSLPFYDALARLDHGIDHVLVRDERHAAYMADAYARLTGRPGVCEGPSGGGATYILPGIVEANESSIPVLAITSDISVSARDRYALTELDQATLFKPLTKFNAVADRADDIPNLFRKAFRAMTTGRPGAAHLGLPYDLQKQVVDAAQLWVQPQHGAFPAFRTGPDPDMVASAAEAILGARHPVFIVGGGVIISGACDQLVELAELLDAPVASTVSGHGTIADDHRLAVGVVGTNGGTCETRDMVAGADLVIFVGCRAGSTTTEHGSVPARGVPVVHIDVDPMVVGANYPCEAALVGDARLCLEALSSEIAAQTGGSARASDVAVKIATASASKRRAFAELVQRQDGPIRPERVLSRLQQLLPADAVIAADPGTPCPYFSGHFAFNRTGRHFLTNRAQGALGYALPAAIGACYARPDATIVAAMGDGSFGFVVGELETIVRKQLPVKMIVFSNAAFGWIKASQKNGYAERYFSVDFGRTDHAGIAAAYGIRSWRVGDPSELDGALKAALAHDGPALVDILTQPLEETAVPVSQWMG